MTAVGKLNPNSTIKEYLRDMQATPTFSERWHRAVGLLEKMLADDFDAWWDSYPADMTKKEFLPIMETKIRELQSYTLPHPPVLRVMDDMTDYLDLKATEEAARF